MSAPSPIAVVHAADGVRFVASARSRDNLDAQIATYVRGRASDMLWPTDAARVLSLLDEGRAEAGIALYFACVGRRWDDEWIVYSP